MDPTMDPTMDPEMDRSLNQVETLTWPELVRTISDLAFAYLATNCQPDKRIAATFSGGI